MTILSKCFYLCGVLINNQIKIFTDMKNLLSYQKRSKVLTIANALVKKGWSFSAAQKHAWNVVRCICEMKKTEVVVRFYKEGQDVPEQRTATLSPAFFSYTSTSTKQRKQNPLQVSFFDTYKNSFRSFNVERFDSFKSAPLPI